MLVEQGVELRPRILEAELLVREIEQQDRDVTLSVGQGVVGMGAQGTCAAAQGRGAAAAVGRLAPRHPGAPRRIGYEGGTVPAVFAEGDDLSRGHFGGPAEELVAMEAYAYDGAVRLDVVEGAA